MRALLAVGVLLVACAPARAPLSARVSSAPLERTAVAGAALTGWDRIEPHAFETLALSTFPDGVAARDIEEPLRTELAQALGGFDARAVRAAVLLGRSAGPRSIELLLQRLEQRVEGPDVGADAADVTAAHALSRLRLEDDPARLERLLALALGATPHPDLEVRVECARACVLHRRDEPIPFLLQVLRIDTWLGQADARDFAPSPQTAWARHRAAEVLSARAGVPKTYHPDGSVERRQIEALKLEQALRAAGALR
jgi:hypothetical protein